MNWIEKAAARVITDEKKAFLVWLNVSFSFRMVVMFSRRWRRLLEGILLTLVGCSAIAFTLTCFS